MKYMVFDVESIGLHGEGFAFAYVVIDETGKKLDEHWAACPRDLCAGDKDDREWVHQNVPDMECAHRWPDGLRNSFWKAWETWKKDGAVLVADCGWPVEHRFLAACVDDDPSRKWDGPYPLHELVSIMMATFGPLSDVQKNAFRKRTDDEKPEHHPLSDARQSARLLAETLCG